MGIPIHGIQLMRFLPKLFGLCSIGLWIVPIAASHAQDLELGEAIQLTEEQIEALTVDPASKSKSEDKDGGGPANATADGDVSGFSVDVSNRNDVLALYHGIYVASENFEATHGWTGSKNDEIRILQTT